MERILQRKTIDPVTGCWNWEGSKDEKGYGLVNRNKQTRRVHRLSFMHFKGEVQPGHCVCHICDNPSCFNPDHLFTGTVLDNNRDRESKHRGADRRGEKHNLSKFTNEDVLNIRLCAATTKLSHAKIAAMYGVTRPTISYIIRRATWQHI